MLARIEQWIDQINFKYLDQRVCCDQFKDNFEGFYSTTFLRQAYFVVIDKIPKPDFPELRQMGLSNFLDMDVDGITYKNTYYILPHFTDNLKLHFHELVHVAQWEHLGAVEFIRRYITEIQTNGYSSAPLEQMAYAFDNHFSNGREKFDISSYVLEKYYN